MKILALDSATARCSIAVLDGDVVRVRRDSEALAGQGDSLPLVVAELLAQAGVAAAALDRLAVTVGPGRFTGLRAGLAFMRGLALATGKPIIGLTTLETLAAAALGHAAPGESLLACVDSRRAEMFFQRFTGDGTAIDAPFAATPEALAAGTAPGTTLLVVGERTAPVQAALAAAGVQVRTIEAAVDAAVLARLAARRSPGAEPPAPLYIHPPATTAPRRAAPIAR